MGVSLDLRTVELLCSRLCHDLVGPVGAINNGVELIEEMGAAAAGDAIELVADSARLATARLKLFRLAYGAAGAEGGVAFDMAEAMLAAWFAMSKVKLAWRLTSGSEPPRGLPKLLLNVALLGEEALPQGGVLEIAGSPSLLVVRAAGKAAGLKPEARAALAGETAPEALTPRSVQGFITGRFAEQFGFTLTLADAPDGAVEFRISMANTEIDASGR